MKAKKVLSGALAAILLNHITYSSSGMTGSIRMCAAG